MGCAVSNGLCTTGESRSSLCFGISAAAFLGLALLVAANLLMRTRLPNRRQRKTNFEPNMKRIITDVPFMICGIGYVPIQLVQCQPMYTHRATL